MALSPEWVASRRAQMFPALGDDQIARVTKESSERSFADGEVLIEQGDSDAPLYVVLEGALEIVHPEGAIEEPVATAGPREFTGEISLLTDRRSLVRIRAKGAVRALRVEHARLRRLIQTDSELSETLMRAFILRRVALLMAGFGDAVVMGSQNCAGTLRVREFLVRNAHPYRYVDLDREPDVQSMLDQFHVTPKDVPILICRGELVLRHPTNAEIAECLGFNPKVDAAEVHDVVICGAGPGGLAAAVYGASEGLDVLVLEANSPGGQAASSSKIENYLGFPTGISGEALTGRALSQAEKFGARILVARGAVRLYCDETPMRIELADGRAVLTRAIVIASGVEYRKLDVAGLAKFEGAGVYYAATAVEAQLCEAEGCVVVGGGNSAGQAAIFLATSARHVDMLIRAPDLASTMSRYLIRRIEETPNITLRRRHRVVGLEGDTHLERLSWRDDATGEEEAHAVRHLFSMTGASPNSTWLRGCVALDEKGFVVTGSDLAREDLAAWSIARAPYLFETNRPRVFAVGDVRANSVKRVASAVGEGSVCIQLVHKVIAE
jgi:thioredoxin reductase (NADPH)